MTRYISKLYCFISRQQVASEEMMREYYHNKHLVNKPIKLEGKNESCVFLIHGWSSTSYEMYNLSQKLNSEGFSVHAPLLPGHGTQPSDLENVSLEDWCDFVENEYLELKKKYKKVYVGGCSLGGNLSILLAQKYKCVSGLVLLGTPFKMKNEKINFLTAKFISLFRKYSKKYYPLKTRKKCGMIRLISYQKFPIKSALEVFKTIYKSRENLKLINQPVLIFQSDVDHLLDKSSIHKIHKSIKSPNKEMKLVPNAYHNFICDQAYDYIYDDIANFFKKH